MQGRTEKSCPCVLPLDDALTALLLPQSFDWLADRKLILPMQRDSKTLRFFWQNIPHATERKGLYFAYFQTNKTRHETSNRFESLLLQQMCCPQKFIPADYQATIGTSLIVQLVQHHPDTYTYVKVAWENTETLCISTWLSTGSCSVIHWLPVPSADMLMWLMAAAHTLLPLGLLHMLSQPLLGPQETDGMPINHFYLGSGQQSFVCYSWVTAVGQFSDWTQDCICFV